MNPIDRIRSAPGGCPLKWEGLIGGDQVRFCSQCQKSVYNLSALTKTEANSLLASGKGKLCIAFSTASDGKLILRSESKRWKRIQYFVRYGLTAFLGLLLPGCASPGETRAPAQIPPPVPVSGDNNAPVSKDITVWVGDEINYVENHSLPPEEQGSKGRPKFNFFRKARPTRAK